MLLFFCSPFDGVIWKLTYFYLIFTLSLSRVHYWSFNLFNIKAIPHYKYAKRKYSNREGKKKEKLYRARKLKFMSSLEVAKLLLLLSHHQIAIKESFFFNFKCCINNLCCYFSSFSSSSLSRYEYNYFSCKIKKRKNFSLLLLKLIFIFSQKTFAFSARVSFLREKKYIKFMRVQRRDWEKTIISICIMYFYVVDIHSKKRN